MRFRFGLLAGAAIGYYLGTRDGRQRYEQINKSLTKLQQNPKVAEATDKARALLDQGVAQAKQAAEERGGVSGMAQSAAGAVKSKVGGDHTDTDATTAQKDVRDTLNSADRKDEPVPYTSPGYDPDKSGRTPASTPSDLPGSAGGKLGTTDKHDVQPSNDPEKASKDGAAGFGNTEADKAKPKPD